MGMGTERPHYALRAAKQALSLLCKTVSFSFLFSSWVYPPQVHNYAGFMPPCLFLASGYVPCFWLCSLLLAAFLASGYVYLLRVLSIRL